ncbi:MAG TPA: hypothetical protein VGB72_03430 [Acidobacteriota bacterium]
MVDATPKMKPIWFFVGLILLSMGLVILLAGLYILYVHPLNSVMILFPRNPESWLGFNIVVKMGPPRSTVLASLHPDIWWGGFMVLAGAIFFLAGRKSTADKAD